LHDHRRDKAMNRRDGLRSAFEVKRGVEALYRLSEDEQAWQIHEVRE
jgi:hypothetical protein